MSKYFGTMAERLRANRATAISLLAAGVGSLVAMTIMSRFTVPIWLVIPALLVLYAAFAARYVLYALFVRLTVLDANTIERSNFLVKRRLSSNHLDFVRYRVRYGAGLSGKKYYFAVSGGHGCEFYLPASVWKEEDLARVAARLNGSLRGSWTNVIDVDLVEPTLGGPCRAW